MSGLSGEVNGMEVFAHTDSLGNLLTARTFAKRTDEDRQKNAGTVEYMSATHSKEKLIGQTG